MNSDRSAQLKQVRTPRPIKDSSVGFDYVRPPTSEGHNFFDRTLFWVFLDSMESPLCQDSRNKLLDGSRGAQTGQITSAKSGQLGWV